MNGTSTSTNTLLPMIPTTIIVALLLSSFPSSADGQNASTTSISTSIPSTTTATTTTTTTDPPTPYPSPLVVFNIDYSRGGCETSAVGMKGFILDEVNSTFYGPPPSMDNNFACAEASRCPIGSTVTDECPTANSFFLQRNDTTKEITANPSWGVVGPDVCRDSAWIPSCYYNYQTIDDLKSNPNILENSNIDDLRLMQNYIYTIYYDDENCKDITSMFSSNSGKIQTLPLSITDDSLPCEVASSCAVDPNSGICQSVRDGQDDTATLIFETRRDESNGEIIVFECDSSNEDAGQQECFPTVPTKCVKSSLYANCYFRHVSGPRLAQDPAFFINGEGVTATPSDPPSLPPAAIVPTDPPTDPPSSSTTSICDDRSFQILVTAVATAVTTTLTMAAVQP